MKRIILIKNEKHFLHLLIVMVFWKKSLRLYRHRKTNTTCSSQKGSMWKYNSNYGSLERLGRKRRGGRIIPKKKKNLRGIINFQCWKAQQGNAVHNILPYVLWRTGWEELASIKELKKIWNHPLPWFHQNILCTHIDTSHPTL